ncbi:Regulator of protease activity HflC, stomatin/prohibitin superfamily [Lachnospiraceae bacterium G11]|jgi:regulator of protease activity HflC (stomatin/prohibitin superfamily)|nr:Regulator of protease activity HflC, stomatin/prohibitin superfamily [Lachnospiraceae bacterium G11]
MKEKKGFGKIVSIVVIAVLALIVISNSFAIIPTGYTGVRVTFGQISNSVVPNGINFKIPFVQEIQKVNNKQQDITFSDTISAETAERNEVFFSGVTVTYQINPSKSSWIYANVSDYKNNLVSENLVASALKGSSKSLMPNDVTNRNILEPLVKDNIQKSLDEKYGSEVVKINKVVVTNATFDDEYNNKIAQKQQAQMAYETQQIENKTAVEKAEADAKVKLRNAQAEADALKVQAEAEAEANKLLEESLTPNVLKNATIEKWNGQLPKVQGAEGTIIDLGDLDDVNYSNVSSNEE